MPVGQVSFIGDPRNNIGTVAPAGNVNVGESFPIIMASYHMSISAASGGTQLPTVPCGKVEIQNLSGNHVMFIGGVDVHAPYSGRGNELPSMTTAQGYPNPQGEKIIYVNNANQISVCSTFSGEMISFIAYGNGINTVIDPATQGQQPDNTPPNLLSTTPASGSTGIHVNQIVTWTFDDSLDPTTTTTSGFYVVTSGQVSPATLGHLGGTISYTPNSMSVTFTPNSGQFVLQNWYIPMVDPSVDDKNGNPVNTSGGTGLAISGGPFQIQSAPTFTTAPLSGVINQAFNQAVVVTFSEIMDPTTVNISGLYIVTSGQASPQTTGHLSGSVVYTSGSTTATINVNSGQYALSGWYVPMGHISLMDPFGVPITAETSGSPYQIIGPPIISGWFPASGSTGASGLINVVGTFSQNMLSSTINTSGMFIVISGQSTPLTAGHVSGIVSLNNADNTLGVIAPNSGQLAISTWYIPFATVNCKDAFGNAVAATISGAPFQTAASFPGDTTPPIVSGTSPVSGATNVNTSGTQQVTFSKSMASSTIVTASLVLRDTTAASNVPNTVSLMSDLKTVIMTPNAGLTTAHVFRFEISGAQDLNANNMTPHSGATFTCESALVVSGTSPVSGATNIDIGTNVIATVSKAYQSGTVTSGTFQLKDIQAGTVNVACAGITMQDTQTIIFVPASFLQLSHLHRVEVSGIKDLDGNFMTPHSGATFTTQAPVSISAIKPSSGTTGVSISTNVSGLFTRAVNSISTSTFKLVDGSGNSIAGTVSLNSNNLNFTYLPNNPLAYGATYTYEISGVQDLALESFMTPFSGASFTTTNPALTQFYNVTSSSSFVDMSTYIRFGEGAAKSSSDLIGRNIKQAQFTLQRVGNPTGTIYCNIRDANDNIKVTLGTISPSSVSTSYCPIIFTNLNANFSFVTSGAIYVEYSGGNGSDTINCMKNGSNQYDSSNSIAFQFNPHFGSQGSTDFAGIMWV